MDTIPAEQLTALGIATDATPDGADLILIVIASLDGGRNGANPTQLLGIEIVGPGVAQYTLTDESDVVRTFTVTVVEEAS